MFLEIKKRNKVSNGENYHQSSTGHTLPSMVSQIGEKRTTQRKSKLPSMQEMAQKQFGLLQKRNEKYCQHLWRIWRSRENENQNCICEVENKSNGK